MIQRLEVREIGAARTWNMQVIVSNVDQSKGSFNDLDDYMQEQQQIARRCTETGQWLQGPVRRPQKIVAYVDYIRVEHIGVDDHVEDSDFAVAAADIAAAPGDHGDVEN